MGVLMLPQLRRKSENLPTPNFRADILLPAFSISWWVILVMEFFHMPSHIALKRKFTVAVLNWTFEEFSLVLKKMASQVVLSSVAGMAIINQTCIRPLQQNQKDQIKVKSHKNCKDISKYTWQETFKPQLGNIAWMRPTWRSFSGGLPPDNSPFKSEDTASRILEFIVWDPMLHALTSQISKDACKIIHLQSTHKINQCHYQGANSHQHS